MRSAVFFPRRAHICAPPALSPRCRRGCRRVLVVVAVMCESDSRWETSGIKRAYRVIPRWYTRCSGLKIVIDVRWV